MIPLIKLRLDHIVILILLNFLEWWFFGSNHLFVDKRWLEKNLFADIPDVGTKQDIAVLKHNWDNRLLRQKSWNCKEHHNAIKLLRCSKFYKNSHQKPTLVGPVVKQLSCSFLFRFFTWAQKYNGRQSFQSILFVWYKISTFYSPLIKKSAFLLSERTLKCIF